MKLTKEQKEFAQWIYYQNTFHYNTYLNKWVSMQYKPKSTQQLFTYFIKQINK